MLPNTIHANFGDIGLSDNCQDICDIEFTKFPEYWDCSPYLQAVMVNTFMGLGSKFV